ncbi:MAG: hypothetical protein AAF675_20965, partial [Pseudomonadota bacterium]
MPATSAPLSHAVFGALGRRAAGSDGEKRAAWLRRSLATLGEQLLERELRRAILWWPAGMAIGIRAYFALPEEPAAWTMAGPLLPLLLLAIPAVRAAMTGRTLTLALLALATGFALAKGATERAAMPRLPGPVTATVEGRVLTLDRA